MMANLWQLHMITQDNQKNQKVNLKKKVRSFIFLAASSVEKLQAKKKMQTTKSTLRLNVPVCMRAIEQTLMPTAVLSTL